MPNKLEHMITGWCVGTIGYALIMGKDGEPVDWNRAAVCGGLGAGAAMLPDAMEPATSPSHRGVMHSAGSGGVALYGAKKILENPQIEKEGKAVATSLIMAYLSHLILDAGTPAGIPLAFKGEKYEK